MWSRNQPGKNVRAYWNTRRPQSAPDTHSDCSCKHQSYIYIYTAQLLHLQINLLIEELAETVKEYQVERSWRRQAMDPTGDGRPQDDYRSPSPEIQSFFSPELDGERLYQGNNHVLGLPYRENNRVLGLPYRENNRVLGLPYTEENFVLIIPYMENSYGQDIPSTNNGQGQDIPCTDNSQGQDIPSTDNGQGQVIPSTDNGQGQDIPCTDNGQGQDIPSTDNGHGQDIPSTDNGHGQDIPSTDNGQGQDIPSTDNGQDQDIPSTDNGQDQDIPSTDNGQDQDIPSTDNGQGQDIPSTDNGQGQDIPSTDNGQGQDIPSTDNGQGQGIRNITQDNVSLTESCDGQSQAQAHGEVPLGDGPKGSSSGRQGTRKRPSSDEGSDGNTFYHSLEERSQDSGDVMVLLKRSRTASTEEHVSPSGLRDPGGSYMPGGDGDLEEQETC
ncbi:putative surface-exposed virulence protein BigA [Procambarus clarkii]|uniref:putative surface-exposed virulence protein BigA n=1 Tax=Procambarus clarkii TaxID=6728 RepID=UPI003744789E